MKKIRLLFTGLLLFLTAGLISAQNISIRGTVNDSSTGEPVAFAYVQIKGTMQGTSTDDLGRFELNAPSNAVLIFTFVGYQTLEVPVNGRTNISVVLTPDALALDEVVLTAYGPQSKKAFTGSAAIVKGEVIENLQVSSISKALQGVASGVMVINSTGQPGENASIRIRGVGSMSATQSPLIVLDGVIFDGNLNAINPNDIESFTVLKDANSTALYGSRAANGVLVITTKIGRPGKARFNFSATYGLSQRAVPDYEYLNSQEYMETMWARLYNDEMKATGATPAQSAANASSKLIPTLVYNPYYPEAEPVGTDGKLKSGARANYEEDWYDVLFRIGQRQEYNLSASGGSREMRYFISGGYLKDEGMVRMSKFDRYTMRAKIDANLTNWLQAGINTALTYSDQNYPTQGGTSFRNSMSFVRGLPSIYPAHVRDKNGNFILDDKGNKQFDYGRGNANVWGMDRPYGPGSNPLATFEYDDISSRRMTLNNSGFLVATFGDFTFRTTLGVDFHISKGKTYYNPYVGDGTGYGGLSERSIGETRIMTWANILTYDKTFADIHHVNVMVGSDSYDNHYEYVAAQKRGFDFADQELTYGATPYTANSTMTGSRNMRYLARVNYDYEDRYHISASYNKDGTSRFYRDVRWGDFWSVGAAWNLGNEAFMAGTRDVLDQLKLRFSYGTSGNQDLGRFPYMATYATGWDILGNLGSVVSTLGNNYLTWEKQKMMDVGVDFAMFSSRLTGSIGYYSKVSEDLLMARPLPLSAGITSYNDNIGEMKNQGVEIELKGILFRTKDLMWDLGVNFTWQKSRVTSLPEESAEGFYGSSYKRTQVGYSLYSWWIPEWAGVDPDTGAAMWYIYDEETDTKTTTTTHASATRRFFGDALPKFIGGINSNFKWKGLYAQILTSFSLGNYILDTDYSGLMHMFVSDRTGYQSHRDVLKRWQQPGDITDVPKIGTDSYGSYSTLHLIKGDYMRIRNITIGYDLATIPALKNIGVDGLKLYFSAENPFTIFGGRAGLDPENGIHAITSNNTSALKVYSFGLNVQF